MFTYFGVIGQIDMTCNILYCLNVAYCGSSKAVFAYGENGFKYHYGKLALSIADMQLWSLIQSIVLGVGKLSVQASDNVMTTEKTMQYSVFNPIAGGASRARSYKYIALC